MPSRGRVKVYLIDEVHMLSKAAFNALLKTLEEPPGHVKFLLATTDPQKLPVTVLSRCLQFNLKRLDEEQIRGQITKILEAETIAADPGAVRQLAKAADGSLRDGLSLLDQAIAYTGGTLSDNAVATMLGTVDRTRVGALLDALAAGEGARLLAEVESLAEFSPDWASVLDAMAEALHRVQVRQLVPAVDVDAGGIDVAALADAVRPELVQLWYQMALNGRRDLALAPSPRGGFEMTLLRMLAFRPEAVLAAKVATAPATPRKAPPMPSAATVAAAPAAATPDAVPQAARMTVDAMQWPDVVARANLKAMVRELGANLMFVRQEGDELVLALPADLEDLRSPATVSQLAAQLVPAIGFMPRLRIEITREAAGDTLHARNARARDERQQAAEDAFLNDPGVKHLLEQGARVVPDSIRPYDEQE